MATIVINSHHVCIVTFNEGTANFVFMAMANHSSTSNVLIFHTLTFISANVFLLIQRKFNENHVTLQCVIRVGYHSDGHKDIDSILK